MKIICNLLFFLLYFINLLFSQDTLIYRNGLEVYGKIQSLNDTAILFKGIENYDSSAINISKNEIFLIKYNNGNKQVFIKADKQDLLNQADENNMFIKGQIDGKKYYKKYRPAAFWTITTTLVAGGIVGLLPAIFTSTKEPELMNLNIPNPELLKSKRYYDGYLQSAKKKKARKVWLLYGIGVGVNVVVFLSFL